ncbi:MAG: WYL domain-containing protein [Candidatus Eisenbacteria sp.]|nr:WYL domain-containing protein [Candidatus Eisenbacteria bacterium]
MIFKRSQLRRFYWIDAALQGGEFPSAPVLARDLGVSPGTIHRDVQSLRSKFRAPITFSPTQRGYAYGRPFRPSLPDLPAEESIGMARNLLRRGEIGESALGESLQRLLQQISHLLPVVPPHPAADHPAADHPAADHPAADHPAADHPAAGTRARTASKTPARGIGSRRPSTARRPAKRDSDGQSGEAGPVTILLRFDRTVAPEVLRAGLFHHSEIQLLTDGGIEATATADDPDSFLLDLLRWAPNFEIAGPPWIRRRLPQLLRRLLKQIK